MTTLLEEQPVEIQSNLESNVLLLSTSIGWWRGMYKLSRNEIHITHNEDNINEEQITTPQAKLMTATFPRDRSGEPWRKRFQSIETALEQAKQRYTVKFPIPGVRIVPRKQAIHFMEQIFGDTVGSLRKAWARHIDREEHVQAAAIASRLDAAGYSVNGTDNGTQPIYNPYADVQSVAYRLHTCAKEFVDQYDDIISQIRDNSEVFDLVENKIPSKHEMLAKFYVDIVPIELAGSTRSNKLTLDDLKDHQALVQEACRRRAEEAIEQIIREPREELAKALADLQQKVASDVRLKSNSFNEVRKAIDKIRLFDFVADDEMLQTMRDLESRLDVTPANSLTSVTAASSGFSAALDTFYKEVTDTERMAEDIEKFGRRRRSLNL